MFSNYFIACWRPNGWCRKALVNRDPLIIRFRALRRWVHHATHPRGKHRKSSFYSIPVFFHLCAYDLQRWDFSRPMIFGVSYKTPPSKGCMPLKGILFKLRLTPIVSQYRKHFCTFHTRSVQQFAVSDSAVSVNLQCPPLK